MNLFVVWGLGFRVRKHGVIRGSGLYRFGFGVVLEVCTSASMGSVERFIARVHAGMSPV